MPVSETRVCIYCDQPPERHSGRCKTVVYDGEVRRCSRKAGHHGACLPRRSLRAARLEERRLVQ